MVQIQNLQRQSSPIRPKVGQALLFTLIGIFLAVTLIDGLWPGAAIAAKTNLTNLTSDEKELAKGLGFTEEALVVIKAALRPEMGSVKMGGLEEPDASFVEIRGTQYPLLPEDRRQYLKIAAAYPELKDMTKLPLEIESGKFTEQEDLNPEVNRMNRVAKAMKKYMPLMSQEELDNPPTSPAIAVGSGTAATLTIEKDKNGIKHNAVRTVTSQYSSPGLRRFKTDKEADDFITEMNKRYAGKTLRKENLGTLYLGLRYFSNDPSQAPADSRIPLLREKLLTLGYRIVEDSCFERKMYFQSRPAAEAFLKEYGIAKDKAKLEDQMPRQIKAIYPIDWQKDLANLEDAKTIVRQSPAYGPSDAASINNTIEKLRKQSKLYKEYQPQDYLEFYPGAEISKAGERRWRINIPRRCSATIKMHSAIMLKAESGPGYELLRLRHTQGIKPFISTEQIIQKLKDWDKRYGVTAG